MQRTHLSHTHMERYIIASFGLALVAVFAYCLLTPKYVRTLILILSLQRSVNLSVNVSSGGLTSV